MAGLGSFVILLIGLAIILTIGIIIVLAVAVPRLREEGRIRASSSQRFRLPHSWTGYDDYGFFGADEETAHLPTREQAAVTAMADHHYVLIPQPRRHTAPSLSTLRPRTRHWKVPETGAGLRTTLNILFR